MGNPLERIIKDFKFSFKQIGFITQNYFTLKYIKWKTEFGIDFFMEYNILIENVKDIDDYIILLEIQKQ